MCAGNLTIRQREIFDKNTLFGGMRLPEVHEKDKEKLEKKLPRIHPLSLDLMKVSIVPQDSQEFKSKIFSVVQMIFLIEFSWASEEYNITSANS